MAGKDHRAVIELRVTHSNTCLSIFNEAAARRLLPGRPVVIGEQYHRHQSNFCTENRPGAAFIKIQTTGSILAIAPEFPVGIYLKM